MMFVLGVFPRCFGWCVCGCCACLGKLVGLECLLDKRGHHTLLRDLNGLLAVLGEHFLRSYVYVA